MFRAELAEVILYPRGTEMEALRTTSRHEGTPEVMVPTIDPQADPLHARIRDATAPFFLPTSLGASDDRSDMVSPLRGESDLIGSLRISNRLTAGTTFSEDDLRLLETLANQAAVALENGHLEQSLAELSRLKEELRFQAYHDPLTGLANRTLFLDQVEARLEDATAGGLPVVLFLDLDDFKIVNDTMGHAAGDRLLIGVAERLREVLRPTDVAARLGGDEFAVLLEDGPELGDAVTVADRIVDVLRSPFPIEGQDIVVGGSIGVAVGTPRVDRRSRAAPQCGRRDVHGQGRRQEPRVGLRTDDARGDRRPSRAQRRAVPEPRPGRARRLLPADRRAADESGRRLRGARPMAASQPRSHQSGRIHPTRRGDRVSSVPSAVTSSRRPARKPPAGPSGTPAPSG